jgi:multidrug efflux system outer membrane protein
MTRFFVLLVALALAGCSFAPPYERPALDLPAAEDAPLMAEWWRRFGDPLLNELVREALEHNRDLLAAGARIEQAAALAGRSAGDSLPRPEFNTEGSRQRLSSNAAGGPPPEANRVRDYSVGLQAAWELDFWEKYYNAWRGAEANLSRAAADRDALALLVAGNVVKTYSALLAARAESRIAESTVAQRKKAEQMQTHAVAVGADDRVALLRVQGELAQARYSLAMAQLRAEQAANALALLLGRTPAQIMTGEAFQTREHLLFVSGLPKKLPFRLLEQRPDLRAAEYALMAEHFNLGVIRAEYLPSVSLSVSSGREAEAVSALGESLSSTWRVMGVLHLPLDFWNTRFRERMSEARCRELIRAYEKAVQNAFRDVRDALRSIENLDAAGAALARMESALAQAVVVADNRYRHGYADYMETLDAERALLDVRLQRAAHHHTRVATWVDLYMALGGGWREGDDAPARAGTP